MDPESYKNLDNKSRKIFCDLIDQNIKNKICLYNFEKYSDKYISFLINNAIYKNSDFDADKVILLLNKTKDIVSLLKENKLQNEINEKEDNSKEEILLHNRTIEFANDYMPKTKNVCYLKKFNKLQYTFLVNVFKYAYRLSFNLFYFFEKLTNAFFDKEKYVIHFNFIDDFLIRVLKDKDLSSSFKVYVKKVIVDFLFYEKKEEDSFISRLFKDIKYSGYIIDIRNTLNKFSEKNDKYANKIISFINEQNKIKRSKIKVRRKKNTDLILTERFSNNFLKITIKKKNDKNLIKIFKEEKINSSSKLRKFIYDNSISLNDYNWISKIFSQMKNTKQKEIIINEKFNLNEMLNTIKEKNYKPKKESKENISINKLQNKYINLLNMSFLLKKKDEKESIEIKLENCAIEINKYYLKHGKENFLSGQIDNMGHIIKNIDLENGTQTILSIKNDLDKFRNKIKNTYYKWKPKINYNEFEKIAAKNREMERKNAKHKDEIYRLNGVIFKHINITEKSKKKQPRDIKNSIESLLYELNEKYKCDIPSSLFKKEVVLLFNFLIKTKKRIMKKILGEKKNWSGFVKMYTIIFFLNNRNIDINSFFENNKKEIYRYGRCVYIKSKKLNGKFLGKYKGKNYIDIYKDIIIVDENDFMFKDLYCGNNAKIIKGIRKGIMGRIYYETDTHVYMTNDEYGSNKNTKVVTIKRFRVLKTDIKLINNNNDNNNNITKKCNPYLLSIIVKKKWSLYKLTLYIFGKKYGNMNMIDYFNLSVKYYKIHKNYIIKIKESFDKFPKYIEKLENEANEYLINNQITKYTKCMDSIERSKDSQKKMLVEYNNLIELNISNKYVFDDDNEKKENKKIKKEKKKYIPKKNKEKIKSNISLNKYKIQIEKIINITNNIYI